MSKKNMLQTYKERRKIYPYRKQQLIILGQVRFKKK